MKPGDALNLASARVLRNWWRALQPDGVRGDKEQHSSEAGNPFGYLGRAARARLRRCRDAVELLTEPAVLHLARALMAAGDGKEPVPRLAIGYERVAWVAGVLASVKQDAKDGRSLPERLGYANSGQDKRLAMSELRFRRLQRTRDPADLLLQWRRAVQLAGGTVDVAVLGLDLLTWLAQEVNPPLASRSIKFRWAHDYYLTDKDKKPFKSVEEQQEMIP